jgi:hypothetical protein
MLIKLLAVLLFRQAARNRMLVPGLQEVRIRGAKVGITRALCHAVPRNPHRQGFNVVHFCIDPGQKSLIFILFQWNAGWRFCLGQWHFISIGAIHDRNRPIWKAQNCNSTLSWELGVAVDDTILFTEISVLLVARSRKSCSRR